MPGGQSPSRGLEQGTAALVEGSAETDVLGRLWWDESPSFSAARDQVGTQDLGQQLHAQEHEEQSARQLRALQGRARSADPRALIQNLTRCGSSNESSPLPPSRCDLNSPISVASPREWEVQSVTLAHMHSSEGVAMTLPGEFVAAAAAETELAVERAYDAEDDINSQQNQNFFSFDDSHTVSSETMDAVALTAEFAMRSDDGLTVASRSSESSITDWESNAQIKSFMPVNVSSAVKHEICQQLPRSNSGCSFTSEMGPGKEDSVESVSRGVSIPDSSCACSEETIHRLACDEQNSRRDGNEVPMGECAKMGESEIASTRPIFVPSVKRSFLSLATALQHASEGDEIRLFPGIYVEDGLVEVHAKNVVVRADESSLGKTKVEVHFTGPRSSLLCNTVGFKMMDIRLIHSLDPAWNTDHWTDDDETRIPLPACINIRSGDACFERCQITSQWKHGVIVSGNARPSFKHCEINKCVGVAFMCQDESAPLFLSNVLRQNQSFAIVAIDSCAGSFSGNVIDQNGKCAVVCGGRASSAFLHNSIRNGLQGAFWVQKESCCLICGNKLEKNRKAGVQVSNQSDPTVKHNHIVAGEGGGIVVHDEAKGTFTRNLIESNHRAGVGIMNQASSVFAGNIIKKNEGGGVVMIGRSCPVFTNNEVCNNECIGICIKEHSTPILIDNTIRENASYGILMRACCSVQVQGCNFIGNHRAGMCIGDESSVIVGHCLFDPGRAKTELSTQQIGISMHDSSSAVIQNSILREHSVSNILMQNVSVATMTSLEVSHSPYGLKLHDHARATLRHNSLSCHLKANILVSDNADLRASGNAIIDGKGCGVKAMHSSRCLLKNNLIMGNMGTGVEARGRGYIEMRTNRVSANAQFGILVDGAVCKLRANAVFGNQIEGLHLARIPSAPIVQGKLVYDVYCLGWDSKCGVGCSRFMLTDYAQLTTCRQQSDARWWSGPLTRGTRNDRSERDSF